MAMNKKKAAKTMYATLCKALDARNWKYKKLEEKLGVSFGVNGDDLPMDFFIFVDEDRQLLRLMSPMSFKMKEDKRVEGAVVTCAANYGMADGSFDYDLTDGKIVFRMVHTFRESLIGEEAVQYIISCACTMVDEYNDRFMAVNSGYLSMADFLEKENDR